MKDDIEFVTFMIGRVEIVPAGVGVEKGVLWAGAGRGFYHAAASLPPQCTSHVHTGTFSADRRRLVGVESD